MKKIVALLCIAVAIVSFAWQFLNAASQLSPASVQIVQVSGSDGDTGKIITKAQKKHFTFTRLSIAEGTQLIVTPEGRLDTVGGGSFSVDNPIVGTVENVFAWLYPVLLLLAGVCLLRCKPTCA